MEGEVTQYWRKFWVSPKKERWWWCSSLFAQKKLEKQIQVVLFLSRVQEKVYEDFEFNIVFSLYLCCYLCNLYSFFWVWREPCINEIRIDFMLHNRCFQNMMSVHKLQYLQWIENNVLIMIFEKKWINMINIPIIYRDDSQNFPNIWIKIFADYNHIYMKLKIKC